MLLRKRYSKKGFDRLVTRAGTAFMSGQRRRQPETPFYHYTTAGGLEGILKSGTIYATDYRHLNDPDEVTRGEEAIQAELDTLIHENGDDTALGDLCRDVEESRRGKRIIDMRDIGIYIGCFSSDGEILPQWKGYSDDAAGFAIGFRTLPMPTGNQKVRDLREDVGVDFRPCVYDVDVFRKDVRGQMVKLAIDAEHYVRTYCDHKRRKKRVERMERIVAQARVAALARLGAMVPFLKGPEYAYEKEWRLLQLGTPKAVLTRRTQRFGDAPYTPVSLLKPTRMDLYEIIVGPRADSVHGPDFARNVAERYGYGDVRIMPSGLRYR